MPTYKQAHFLTRAVASFSSQTLSDWELILVDDGSPDETQEIMAPLLALDLAIAYILVEAPLDVHHRSVKIGGERLACGLWWSYERAKYAWGVTISPSWLSDNMGLTR